MRDDIVARLRESDGGYFMRQMFIEAADEIERLRELSGDSGRLREERDEARREICIRSAGFIRADRWMKTPPKVAHWSEEEVALSRGWDCFTKEEEQ